MKKVATTQQVIAALKKAGIAVVPRYTTYLVGVSVKKGGYTFKASKMHASISCGDRTPIVSQANLIHALYEKEAKKAFAKAKRVLKQAGIKVIFE